MSHQASLYYHTGSLDGISMRGNKDSFRKCRIVPRVMRNVSSVRPQTTIFGLESALPIYISPASNAMLGHPDGELNMTRGVSQPLTPRCKLMNRPQRQESSRVSRTSHRTPYATFSRRRSSWTSNLATKWAWSSKCTSGKIEKKTRKSSVKP